jgi:hypothetical protein
MEGDLGRGREQAGVVVRAGDVIEIEGEGGFVVRVGQGRGGGEGLGGGRDEEEPVGGCVDRAGLVGRGIGVASWPSEACRMEH